jgi:hypothetical protein
MTVYLGLNQTTAVVSSTWSWKDLDMNIRMLVWVSNCAGETFQVSINNFVNIHMSRFFFGKTSQDFWQISSDFILFCHALEHKKIWKWFFVKVFVKLWKFDKEFSIKFKFIFVLVELVNMDQKCC